MKHSFLDALASLGSMLESDSVTNVFEICQILGISSDYLQCMIRVCSGYVQSVFRVCSECVQSLFRVCSESVQCVFSSAGTRQLNNRRLIEYLK